MLRKFRRSASVVSGIRFQSWEIGGFCSVDLRGRVWKYDGRHMRNMKTSCNSSLERKIL